MKLNWKKWDWPLIGIFLGALMLRLRGIGFGLPGLAFSDEPHHINIAVSFGSGHFDPVFFKYPTFWMYLLFTAFMVVFVFWSGLGFVRTPADYAHLFVWKPTLFYMTARFLTGLAGALAIVPLYYASKRLFHSRSAALLTVVIYAVAPPLIFYSHQAKPDTLMLLLSACAWLFAIRFHQTGQTKDALGFGISLGLALSTQYTALLLAPLLLWAHALRPESRTSLRQAFGSSALVLGMVVVPFVFCAGSPFTIVHPGDFWRDFSDLRAYGSGELTAKKILLGWNVIKLYTMALGPQALSALLLALTIIFSLAVYRTQALLLIVPLLWGGVALGLQNKQAGVENYLFSLYPGLFLLMGSFALFLSKFMKHRFYRPVILAAALLPAFFETVRIDQNFSKEDTRLSAKKWIETHVPQGTRILLDQPHASPYLIPTRDQVNRLLSQTEVLKNPRARYYRYMLDSHPGGGYEILRIDRTQKELISPIKRQTEISKQAWEWLDVGKGLDALKAARIQYVVWATNGATPDNSPRLNQFFEDLFTKGKFVKEFASTNSVSPTVKIYEIELPSKDAKR